MGPPTPGHGPQLPVGPEVMRRWGWLCCSVVAVLDGNISSTRTLTIAPAPAPPRASPSHRARRPRRRRDRPGPPLSRQQRPGRRHRSSRRHQRRRCRQPPLPRRRLLPSRPPASPEALGWILLVVLVAALIAAVLIWRSRRNPAWDAEAAALERDTPTTTSTRLPPVLTAETAGQRALSWPPLRTGLMDLIGRWDLQAGRASDHRRRNRGRTDPQPAPGVGRSRGRRERGTGLAGLEAPAATGGRGRAGPVCGARRCPATGATP
jgi:hypothetical protein